MNIKAIEKWITTQLLELPGLQRFVVRHLQLEGRGRDLGSYTAAIGGDADVNARRVVDSVVDTVVEHVEAYDGIQRYTLVALSIADKELCARDFVEHGTLRSRYEGQSNPPTTTGIVNMLMHHIEAKERLGQAREHETYQLIKGLTDNIVKENVSLRASRDALEEMTTRRRIEVEHLVDGREMRALTARSAERDEKRKDEALEKLKEICTALGINWQALAGSVLSGMSKPTNGGGNGGASTGGADNGHGASKANGEPAKATNGAATKATNGSAATTAPTATAEEQGRAAGAASQASGTDDAGARRGGVVDGSAHKAKLADAFSKLPAHVLDQIGEHLTKAELDELLP